MNDADQKVLAVVTAPRTHQEIVRQTGLARNEVKAAVTRLKKQGTVFTSGRTAAVHVMTAAAACGEMARQLEATALTLRNLQEKLDATASRTDVVQSIYDELAHVKWRVDRLSREVNPPRRTGRPRKA